MQAMTATVAMETPTPTPMAVLLLWDVCVVAAALWVDAEGALVPVLLEKYGELNPGSQLAAKAGRGGSAKSPRDFGGISPLLYHNK